MYSVGDAAESMKVFSVGVISGKRLRLKTRCFNQDKVLGIDGEAIIVLPRIREKDLAV